MTNIYNYWDTKEAFKDWEKPRDWEKRFRSERHFLERIFKPGMSILDIGCAAGDLHIGLLERFGQHRYVGTDTSPEMIKAAKQFSPDADFYVGDITKKDLFPREHFDIVTATGVFQHEPEYKALLNTMLEYTKVGGKVLFDVKLFNAHPSISDINVAYCDLPDRLYFNVLNFKDAIAWLKNVDNIINVDFYGYYSGKHKSVRLPDSVQEEVCSAHILLNKGLTANKNPLVNFELPGDFYYQGN